jgi:nicotinate-nucleotide adenylyltransferase
MNIGILGGTFDPIHRGHLALAQAAQAAFSLNKIYVIPANLPPHKREYALAPYLDRYAMVALACAEEKTLLPSSLEAPVAVCLESSKKSRSGPRPNYSIDTVRVLKAQLKKSDQLFFILGIDAFQAIASWQQAEELLAECEFIVASRPGYSLADVANALPKALRPSAAVTKPFARQVAKGQLILPGVTVHFLEDLKVAVSATAIRDAVKAKRPLTKWLTPEVADYIKKMGLYAK